LYKGKKEEKTRGSPSLTKKTEAAKGTLSARSSGNLKRKEKGIVRRNPIRISRSIEESKKTRAPGRDQNIVLGAASDAGGGEKGWGGGKKYLSTMRHRDRTWRASLRP